MSDHNNNHRLERYIRYAFIILSVFLIVLAGVFIFEYQALRHAQIITADKAHWSIVLKNHSPLPVGEAAIIRSWMTFDYINKLFALPPSYLETQLSITNTHYPRLTIAGYTASEHLDQATFLNEVENAVRGYASTTPAPLPPLPEGATGTKSA